MFGEQIKYFDHPHHRLSLGETDNGEIDCPVCGKMLSSSFYYICSDGDPTTGKLKNRPQPPCISGKRKRKLLRKWRREQKDAIEKGLVSMEDVEMAALQGTSQDTDKMPTTFHMKKSLKLKQLKRRGKNKRKSSMPATEASVDAMVE